jgi:hypothetical protein
MKWIDLTSEQRSKIVNYDCDLWMMAEDVGGAGFDYIKARRRAFLEGQGYVDKIQDVADWFDALGEDSQEEILGS